MAMPKIETGVVKPQVGSNARTSFPEKPLSTTFAVMEKEKGNIWSLARKLRFMGPQKYIKVPLSVTKSLTILHSIQEDHPQKSSHFKILSKKDYIPKRPKLIPCSYSITSPKKNKITSKGNESIVH